MSLRVLVIPENPSHNGYILKPLAQALMAAAGRPRAIVNVLSSPRLTGYDHAVRALKGELPGRYAHYDLWLFMPDADRASDAAMAALEAELRAQGINLLACPARPEVEIFACVAHRAELGLHWSEAREHRSFKEQVFEPLLARRGDTRRPGGGRDMLIAASLGRASKRCCSSAPNWRGCWDVFVSRSRPCPRTDAMPSRGLCVVGIQG